MAPTNPAIDDLQSRLDSDIEGLNSSYSGNLAKYFETPQITPSQALVQGVMNILPMIIGGAIARKKGALIGGQAGALGAKQYGDSVVTENKRQQANALLNAENDKDLLKTTRAQKNDIDKLEITEGGKADRFDRGEINKNARASAANATTLKAAGEMKVNPVEAEVFKSQVIAKKIQKAASSLREKLDKLPQTESAMDATFDNAFAKLDPTTDRAAVQRDLLKSVGAFKDGIVGGGVMSEQDFDRVFTVLGGKWNTPVQVIRTIVDELEQRGIDEANVTREVATSGDFRMKFPQLDNIKKPGSPSPANPQADLLATYGSLRQQGKTPEEIKEILGLD